MTISPEEIACDVVVVGAGPAGLFSVFQCGMLGLRCAVIDASPGPGGQCAALYPQKPIYDVPGHPTILAEELVVNLTRQAAPFHPQMLMDRRAIGLTQGADGKLTVTTDRGDAVTAAAVIIAAGGGAFGPNRPPLDGIEAYEGRCVQYHVPDREALRGRKVVIAGGGDSAVDWALALRGVADKIMVVHRRAKFRAAPDSSDKLAAAAAAGEIDLVIPYQLAALEGDGETLSAVIVADLKGAAKRLEADRLLPFFGLAMDLGPIAEWGLALDHHRIAVTPATCESSIPGVYAVGDVAVYPGKLKLILTGFAEAAQAAHAAFARARPGQALHVEHSTSRGVTGL